MGLTLNPELLRPSAGMYKSTVSLAVLGEHGFPCTVEAVNGPSSTTLSLLLVLSNAGSTTWPLASFCGRGLASICMAVAHAALQGKNCVLPFSHRRNCLHDPIMHSP